MATHDDMGTDHKSQKKRKKTYTDEDFYDRLFSDSNNFGDNDDDEAEEEAA